MKHLPSEFDVGNAHCNEWGDLCHCSNSGSNPRFCFCFILRVPLRDISVRSCTDIRQAWGKLKKKIEEQYQPVSSKSFMCGDHTAGAKGRDFKLEVDLNLKQHLLSTFAKGV